MLSSQHLLDLPPSSYLRSKAEDAQLQLLTLTLSHKKSADHGLHGVITAGGSETSGKGGRIKLLIDSVENEPDLLHEISKTWWCGANAVGRLSLYLQFQHPILMPVPVLAAPLPVQFSAKAAGKAVEDGTGGKGLWEGLLPRGSRRTCPR